MQSSRGWKGPLDISSQPPPGTGPVSAPSSECLQRWRLHSLPGQTVTVSHHPHSKNLPVLKQDLLNSHGCPLPLALSLGTAAKPWLHLPCSLSQEFMHTEHLFCRLSSASPQPLPLEILQGESQCPYEPHFNIFFPGRTG